MIQKLFLLDKNYILRQAQTSAEEEGIALMVAELKHAYTLLYNPLQLMDDTYVQILSTNAFPKDSITVIYRQLSGIYRYRFGSNQLEILFDGRTHLEKYREDWLDQLREWIRELGMQEPYVKTMLRMSLLYDTESRAVFAENRCKSLINDYFSLKIVKRKGDLVLKMA
jgi:hypothetical protein